MWVVFCIDDDGVLEEITAVCSSREVALEVAEMEKSRVVDWDEDGCVELRGGYWHIEKVNLYEDVPVRLKTTQENIMEKIFGGRNDTKAI